MNYFFSSKFMKNIYLTKIPRLHLFSIPKYHIPNQLTNRSFHYTASVNHFSESEKIKNAPSIVLKFKNKNGTITDIQAKVGMSILEVAHRNEIDLEGACESSLACSTCHVILDDDVFNKLPEASEEEDDMLDLAYGLTSTSRLGCQVIVTEDMNNTTINLPAATRNFYVDGHVPKPH